MNIKVGDIYQDMENYEKLIKITDIIPNMHNTQTIVIFREVFLDTFFSDSLPQPLLSFEFYKESKKTFLPREEFGLFFQEYDVDHTTMIQIKAGTFKRSKNGKA